MEEAGRRHRGNRNREGNREDEGRSLGERGGVLGRGEEVWGEGQ